MLLLASGYNKNKKQVGKGSLKEDSFKEHLDTLGTMVKWLWEETYVQEVVSLNPNIGYQMDPFPHLPICCKIVLTFETNENK